MAGRDERTNIRKELWTRDAALDKDLTRLRGEVNSLEGYLNSVAGKSRARVRYCELDRSQNSRMCPQYDRNSVIMQAV